LTICLAIRCKDSKKGKAKNSILFASDTQISSSFLKCPTSKFFHIFGKRGKNPDWEGLVAFSGDYMVAQEVSNQIYHLLHERIDPKKYASVMLGLMREEIGDLAYSVYKKYLDRGVKDPYFELLIGISDRFSALYHITAEGKSEEIDFHRIIGSGRITGGELLLREFSHAFPTLEQAKAIAILVINAVGNIDISVGGEPEICICRNKGLEQLSPQEIQELSKTIDSKWKLFKKIWEKNLEDGSFEKKLFKLLESN
jgi:20S proteasome alpha/beta subunit